MVNLKMNVKNTQGMLKTPWNLGGVNSCHAILWERKDLQRHAIRLNKECGFRYVRFHNFISKWTEVYSEDEMGNPVYNFKHLDVIYDNVIRCGYLPFLEISFCPEVLSKNIHAQTFYQANTAMPDSMGKWELMIRNIIQHFRDRYGVECLRKWYFEVWNEPDLFNDGTMTKDIYFELYDYTARAIKGVDSEFKVGGPATSKCLWIKEFIDHIEAGSTVFEGNRVPCDFISTHAYPSDLAYLDADYADVQLKSSNIMLTLFKKTREIIDNSSLNGVPLIMGEWNSSAGPYAINHDHKNNAAYIVKIFDDLNDIISSSLYWNMSDIYQERDFHYVPFHGGYGLITVNDIPKSSFNAFAMLNEVKGEKIEISRLGEDGPFGYIAALNKDENMLNVLFYNYEEPEEKGNHEITFEVEIDGILSETTNMAAKSVCDESGSAYEWWLKIGSPQFVNKDILDFLEKKSMPKEDYSTIYKDKNSGKYRLIITLGLGDITLCKIHI